MSPSEEYTIIVAVDKTIGSTQLYYSKMYGQIHYRMYKL